MRRRGVIWALGTVRLQYFVDVNTTKGVAPPSLFGTQVEWAMLVQWRRSFFIFESVLFQRETGG